MVEGCLPNVLNVAFSALHEVNDKDAFAGGVFEDGVGFFGLLAGINDDIDSICRQHKLFVFVRHGRHFPFSLVFFFLKTLLSLIVVWPIRSFRFLFLL